MKEFIESFPGGLVGFIVAVVVLLNTVLAGVSAFLGIIKDKTESETDNKIWAILNTITGFLKNIIDFLSANTKK